MGYDEGPGTLLWETSPRDESYTQLPVSLRTWVPARLAALVDGTGVLAAGLPQPISTLPIVKALLLARADVNAQNEDPDNDLDNFSSTTFKDIEQRDHRTALHCAAEAGAVELCAELISGRADVDIKDRFKMTPLDAAIDGGSVPVAEL